MIIKTDKDIIQSYFEDYSGLRGGYANEVVVPENEDEIRKAVKEYSKTKTPIAISGAGTGVTGGRIPFGGTLLSLENLNKILEVKKESEESGTAVVQPCVSVSEIKKRAGEIGLLYAPDPTEQSSSIGGNASTDASGSRGLKYGSTRKHIKRIRVVLSDGAVVNIKRGETFALGKVLEIPVSSGSKNIVLPDYTMPNVKNASGYYIKENMDLIDLFIGHEGTLGVITEIELNLIRLAEKTFSGVAFFPSANAAFNFVQEAKRKANGSANFKALSLEYFDDNSLRLLKEDYPNIPSFAVSSVYFEQEVTPETENMLIDEWTNLLLKYESPIEDVWFATTGKDQDAFREFRHRLPEMINTIVKRNGFAKVGTDIAVPEKSASEMFDYYTSKLSSTGISFLVFGHIGENHMHANILPANSADYAKAKESYIELVERAVHLGGTVSAEHGIGKIKHNYLEKMYGKRAIMEMVRLKKSIDPSCILSPDNVFPKELLF